MLETGKHLGYLYCISWYLNRPIRLLIPAFSPDQIRSDIQYVLDVDELLMEYHSWAPYFSCHKCNFHIQKSSHFYVNFTKKKDRKNSDVLVLQSHFWDFTALNDLSVSWTDSTRVAWAPGGWGGGCACSPVNLQIWPILEQGVPRFPPAWPRVAGVCHFLDGGGGDAADPPRARHFLWRESIWAPVGQNASSGPALPKLQHTPSKQHTHTRLSHV